MGSSPGNRDGGIHRLTWTRDPTGAFRAWVVDRPDIVAIDNDWHRTRAALLDRIDRELQAGEWAADWAPPEPSEDDPRFHVDAQFVTLVGEGRHVPFNSPEDLYVGGICGTCNLPAGPRSASAIATFIETAGGILLSRGFAPDLFLERTVAAFGPERLGGATLREVHRIGRGRLACVEAIASEVTPAVAMAQPADYIGWRCPACARSSFSHRFFQNEYREFISASSIPRGRESFWIDTVRPRLCVRQDWWSSHRRDPAFKGVLARPLWVLRDDAIEPKPAFKIKDWGASDRRHKTGRLRRSISDHALSLPPELVGWIDPQ